MFRFLTEGEPYSEIVEVEARELESAYRQWQKGGGTKISKEEAEELENDML